MFFYMIFSILKLPGLINMTFYFVSTIDIFDIYIQNHWYNTKIFIEQ